MPYVAKERIYVNDAGQPCAEDDPRVAVMVAAPGGRIADDDAQRYGLTGDKRLAQIDAPPQAPAPAERGTDYYELTGGEKPVTKAMRAVLGDEAPAPQPAAQPASQAAPQPASQAKAEAAPAKAKG